MRGRVRIRVTGAGAERLYAETLRRGFCPSDLRRESGEALLFTLPARYFKKLLPLRRLCRVHIRILEKRGVPFLLFRYRRRVGILIGVVLIAAAVGLSSLFVWRIRFEGEMRDEAALTENLRQAGLFTGAYRPGLNATRIEQEMLAREKGLSFISVVFKGTTAEVEVIYEKDAPPLTEQEPCDLVAARGGVIASLSLADGRPLVSPGEAVEQGQILVSAQMLGMEEQPLRLAHSAGQVYAHVAETIDVKMPYESRTAVYTGRRTTNYSLRIFGISIKFYFGTGIPYTDYDKIETEDEWRIGEFTLPVSFFKSVYREKQTVTESVSPETAEAAARVLLEEEAARAFFGCEIEEEKITVSHQTGQCVARGEYTVIRDIALPAPYKAGEEKAIGENAEDRSG